MLANMPLKKPLDQEEPARQKSQHRAAEERYRLRVDGQLKRSFDTKEAALAAGQVIKKRIRLLWSWWWTPRPGRPRT